MNPIHKLRVATYNVHRCRGLDRRVRPDRIVAVLRGIDADIVGLQEVLSRKDRHSHEDQAHYIADQLGLQYVVGATRHLRDGVYGNVVLTRFPLCFAQSYDLTVRGAEARACLRADLRLSENQLLHVFNVHLGTAFLERRVQGRKLLDAEILLHKDLAGPRVVLGDFNEWTRGLTTRLLAGHLESPDLRTLLRRRRTYPGIFPVLHLDHIYFDPALRLERLAIERSRTALVASDHLPLVADFSWS